jgi:hypothetical protein
MTRKSLIFDNLNNFLHRTALKNKFRLINDQILNNFQPMLREETCDIVYNKNNFNKMVNDFQCILIGNFENSLPTIYTGNRPKNNNRITKDIKLTRKRKRQLYILYRNTNNLQIKRYYAK